MGTAGAAAHPAHRGGYGVIKAAAYDWQEPGPIRISSFSLASESQATGVNPGPGTPKTASSDPTATAADRAPDTVAASPWLNVPSTTLAHWAASSHARSLPADPLWLLQAARLLNEAQEEAEQIRQQAQEEKKAILASARQEAEELRRQAQEKGEAEGRRQGEEAVRRELADLFAAAQKVSEAALRFQEEIIRSSQQELVHLALAIAHKLVGDALAEPGRLAVQALREALLRYRPASQTITVRVNVKDLALVESHRDEFLRLCQGTRQWRVVADEQVGEGGCLIETEQGIIDGRLESRLGLVQNAVQEVMNGEPTADGSVDSGVDDRGEPLGDTRSAPSGSVATADDRRAAS